jgi:hypothetical protein
MKPYITSAYLHTFNLTKLWKFYFNFFNLISNDENSKFHICYTSDLRFTKSPPRIPLVKDLPHFPKIFSFNFVAFFWQNCLIFNNFPL